MAWPDARRRVDQPDHETRRALEDIRVLDPAVGSGAFLLGALRLLGGPGGPSRRRATRLRNILAANLFGVDHNAAAVRLAELRLWLEVVASDPSERPEDVAPLPNLDALIRQGDSLVDPAAGLPLPPPDPRRAAALAALRGAVVRSSGAAKPRAVAALLRTEREIAAAALREAVASMDQRISDILEVARSPTLFGGRHGLDRAARATLAELRPLRRRARHRLRALERVAELPWFHYHTHFADVFARGGFDLVVGNPPWVRAEGLAPEQRRYLAQRFRWFRGARSGKAGYAHLPDLSVPFVERALELLAGGGVAALLLPAKIATAGYGAVARCALASGTTLAVAADLREDARAGFDATVYPMALIAALTPPSAGTPGAHQARRGRGVGSPAVAGRRTLDPPLRCCPRCAGPAAPVVSLAGGAVRLPSGGQDRAQPHLPRSARRHRAALLRWAVRGRDVRAFRVRRGRRLLWPCDERGAPLGVLPPIAARYMARHAAELRRRADHAGGSPWSLFRTRAASAPFRVIWSDLAQRLEARR
jgi:hypothetical protein